MTPYMRFWTVVSKMCSLFCCSSASNFSLRECCGLIPPKGIKPPMITSSPQHNTGLMFRGSTFLDTFGGLGLGYAISRLQLFKSSALFSCLRLRLWNLPSLHQSRACEPDSSSMRDEAEAHSLDFAWAVEKAGLGHDESWVRRWAWSFD